jgi:hypothetical protein
MFFGVFLGDVGVSTGITQFSCWSLDDGLLIALAFVRQQELDPPVEAALLEPFSLYSDILTCPQDNPQDNPQDIQLLSQNPW